MAYSQDFTCPEICRIEAGRDPSSEHIDAMAHDVWGLGYLLCWLLTGCTCFSPPDKSWEAVCKQHDEWVSLQQMLLCFILFTAACMTGRHCLSIWPLWSGSHTSPTECLASRLGWPDDVARQPRSCCRQACMSVVSLALRATASCRVCTASARALQSMR